MCRTYPYPPAAVFKDVRYVIVTQTAAVLTVIYMVNEPPTCGIQHVQSPAVHSDPYISLRIPHQAINDIFGEAAGIFFLVPVIVMVAVIQKALVIANKLVTPLAKLIPFGFANRPVQSVTSGS